MTTYDKIYKVVCDIPKGKVATYGLVATLIGNPRLSRVVGYALHVNPQPGIIQKKLLEDEGIIFELDGSIDLKKYCWCPESYELTL